MIRHTCTEYASSCKVCTQLTFEIRSTFSTEIELCIYLFIYLSPLSVSNQSLCGGMAKYITPLRAAAVKSPNQWT